MYGQYVTAVGNTMVVKGADLIELGLNLFGHNLPFSDFHDGSNESHQNPQFMLPKGHHEF